MFDFTFHTIPQVIPILHPLKKSGNVENKKECRSKTTDPVI